jgi:hypothetical protein
VDQLAFERIARPRSPGPYVVALETGAWHGAWALLLGCLPSGAAYVLRHGELALPWAHLGAQLATFVATSGALYGAAIALGDAVSRERRAARAARGESNQHRGLEALTPAAGGAVAGLAPGAFAAERFGRITAPYFGTLPILFVGGLAFFLYGAARLRAEGAPARHTIPALSVALLAPVVVFGALSLGAPEAGASIDLVVRRSADQLSSLALFGAAFGAALGGLYGGLLGCARLLVERWLRASTGASCPYPRESRPSSRRPA